MVGRGNFRDAAAFIEKHSSGERFVFHTDDRSLPSINYYLDGEKQQFLINSKDMTEIYDQDQFWLVIVNPSSAVSYMEASVNQNDLSKTQFSPEKSCKNFLDDNKFEINQSQSYEGKNELFICHFIRKYQ